MYPEHSNQTKSNTCKNCYYSFEGKFCPNCGQSVKEFERPIQFLIIDFVGNIFAFDTRFWKTFIAILFKPGSLALDYVKGHRVKYVPPFRFYIFISFIFFFLLSQYSDNKSKAIATNKEFLNFKKLDSLEQKSFRVGVQKELNAKPKEVDLYIEKFIYFKEHPEVFIKQFISYFSWSMFLLMPLYGFLLWIFYRKKQPYYVTHFIMALNQHAFLFVVLSLLFVLMIYAPNVSSSFRNYLLLLIPLYFGIGYITLYKQKIWKAIIKLSLITCIYGTFVLAVTMGLVFVVFLKV